MDEKSTQFYPPVVAVLGHVDHGKTTLLDAIRKTNVAALEHGSITQRIGASTIVIPSDGQTRAITFIDTPGHELFSLMRSRGAKAADLGMLVVSSVEGVKPQTRESIAIFQKNKIPFIVVLTKVDLPEKAVEKVKQQLIKEGVMLEGLGGDTPVIEVSAIKGKNIESLLALTLLVFDMHCLAKQKKAKDPFEAVVIESRLDPKRGSLATIVVKSGKVGVRDEVVSAGAYGRIRTLLNDQGRQVPMATVGDAVEVLGLPKELQIGEFLFKEDRDRAQTPLQPSPPTESGPLHAGEHPLSVILCAETLGSLEAIVNALPKEAHIVAQKTAEPSESDVLLAKSTGAIILAFGVKTKASIAQLAKTEKVLVCSYKLIYELLDEVKEVLSGKELAVEEKVLGRAKVIAKFPYEKTHVLGVSVLEGRIAKGDRAWLMRGETVLGESAISSLRQGKQPVSKVEKGQEAGVLLSPYLDFTIGDVLTCHG